MRIWFALVAAPVLALADQSISYAMVGWACAHQHRFIVHAVHVPFLLATAIGTIAAWQVWRATLPTRAGDEALARRHFLAGLAVGASALSAAVIVAMWVPTWVLAPCFS